MAEHSMRTTPDSCLPLANAIARERISMRAGARGTYPGDALAPAVLPGLMTAGIWNAVGPQDWGLPWHRNEGIEICCMLTGQTAFSTDMENAMNHQSLENNR